MRLAIHISGESFSRRIILGFRSWTRRIMKCVANFPCARILELIVRGQKREMNGWRDGTFARIRITAG